MTRLLLVSLASRSSGAMYCAVPTQVCALSTRSSMSIVRGGVMSRERTSCFKDLAGAKVADLCAVVVI